MTVAQFFRRFFQKLEPLQDIAACHRGSLGQLII
jgi:hypothetical protein